MCNETSHTFLIYKEFLEFENDERVIETSFKIFIVVHKATKNIDWPSFFNCVSVGFF